MFSSTFQILQSQIIINDILKKWLSHDKTISEMLKRHGSVEGDDDEVGDIV